MLARWSTYDTTAALGFPAAVDHMTHSLGLMGRNATSEPRVHDVAPQLGPRLDTEPRPFREVEEPVRATHPRLNEAKIGIEDRVLMLMVRDLVEAHGTVQARSVEDTHADGRMRHHSDALLRREVSDRDELR